MIAGCSGNSPGPEPPGGRSPENIATIDSNAPAVRAKLTAEECKAKGFVVGDIGDGATQRDSYRCPNGKPPIGNVSWGIEGAVCCAN